MSRLGATRSFVAGLLALLHFGAGAQAGGADAGRQLFNKDATPPCAICHTLKDAGATGAVGPSLDELKPDEARVLEALKSGVGIMPPYSQLSMEQRQAIARYVARASGAVK